MHFRERTEVETACGHCYRKGQVRTETMEENTLMLQYLFNGFSMTFRFDLAQECLHKAQDFGGLLLIATASGNKDMIGKLATSGVEAGQNNVAFMSRYIMGDTKECLDLLINTGRLPEAAFFARTHLPARLPEVVAKWKEQVGQVSEKASKSLADPEGYPNLFPNFDIGASDMDAGDADDEVAAEQVAAEPVDAPPIDDGDDDVDILEEEIDNLKVGS